MCEFKHWLKENKMLNAPYKNIIPRTKIILDYLHNN